MNNSANDWDGYQGKKFNTIYPVATKDASLPSLNLGAREVKKGRGHNAKKDHTRNHDILEERVYLCHEEPC
jgi:hypothetical protein